MNRAEHLAWAKKRALEQLDYSGIPGAIASMLSDLGKHEGTAASQMMGAVLAIAVRTDDQCRKWIEGFN